jgi:hypothetical protein
MKPGRTITVSNEELRQLSRCIIDAWKPRIVYTLADHENTRNALCFAMHSAEEAYKLLVKIVSANET